VTTEEKLEEIDLGTDP